MRAREDLDAEADEDRDDLGETLETGDDCKTGFEVSDQGEVVEENFNQAGHVGEDGNKLSVCV